MPRPSLKERILEKGAELIHQHGFTASGVGDITGAAGVPKGSFYNHFESKEAFGLAVLERYYAASTERARSLLEDRSLGAIDRLESYFQALTVDLATHDFAHGCLIGNFVLEAGCTSEPIRARLTRMFAEWTGQIAQIIREAQASGEIETAEDPNTLADFIIHAWEGAVLRMKVERSPAPLEACRHVLFSTLLRRGQQAVKP